MGKISKQGRCPKPQAGRVCVKFYSKGQMSGKKWEDALSSNCTLQDEHL
ncbi:hypothetical protein SAMN02745208_03105, partial [Heyndrickxia coagulans DSM 1 = ATCC 7050]